MHYSKVWCLEFTINEFINLGLFSWNRKQVVKSYDLSMNILKTFTINVGFLQGCFHLCFTSCSQMIELLTLMHLKYEKLMIIPQWWQVGNAGGNYWKRILTNAIDRIVKIACTIINHWQHFRHFRFQFCWTCESVLQHRQVHIFTRLCLDKIAKHIFSSNWVRILHGRLSSGEVLLEVISQRSSSTK